MLVAEEREVTAMLCTVTERCYPQCCLPGQVQPPAPEAVLWLLRANSKENLSQAWSPLHIRYHLDLLSCPDSRQL